MNASTPSIFVCYRRRDSNAAAFGIYERLKAAFGQSAVFLDHFDFEAGQNWREQTRPIIERARAVVVVLDKDWLAIAKDRFANEDDPVRRELELARDNHNHSHSPTLVVPVVIDDVTVPSQAEIEAFRPLGESVLKLLAWLFGKTALRVRFDRSFHTDVQELIRVLDRHPGIDLAGAATGLDVGGLHVVKPWALTASRPRPRADDPRASDLWILQAKYHAIPLVGRDGDLASLRSWLETGPVDRGAAARGARRIGEDASRIRVPLGGVSRTSRCLGRRRHRRRVAASAARLARLDVAPPDGADARLRPRGGGRSEAHAPRAVHEGRRSKPASATPSAARARGERDRRMVQRSVEPGERARRVRRARALRACAASAARATRHLRAASDDPGQHARTRRRSSRGCDPDCACRRNGWRLRRQPAS